MGFLENAREEWPQIGHVDIFWPPSEQITVTVCWFSSYWRRFDLEKQAKLGASGIFLRAHGRSGLKFDMLMYPDHLWNWLHMDRDLLVLLILAPFWLSETGKICTFQVFSWQCMGGIGRYLFISMLWYPQKWKMQSLAHENYPVIEQGVSLTFLVGTSLHVSYDEVNSK